MFYRTAVLLQYNSYFVSYLTIKNIIFIIIYYFWLIVWNQKHAIKYICLTVCLHKFKYLYWERKGKICIYFMQIIIHFN